MPPPRSRPTLAVIFHIGRCGSTVLADMLRQHEEIYWPGEIYEPLMIKWRGPWCGERERGERRTRIRNRLIWHYRRASGAMVCGIEAKFFHLDFGGWTLPGYIAFLHRFFPVKFILLERRNMLRKIVSSAKAHADNVWHLPASDKPAADTDESESIQRISLDIGAVGIDQNRRGLLDLLKSYGDSLDQARTLLGPHRPLHLVYEDDVENDPRIAYGKLCAFFGLTPNADIRVNYRRTTPQSLRAVLANAEAVEEALAGTGYEWMLEG